MTTDCHTHVGEDRHLFGEFRSGMERSWPEVSWAGTTEQHWAAMSGVERAVVLAFDAPAVGYVVPNEYVAEYVAQHPDRLVGFASVDPNREDWRTRLNDAVDDLSLAGLKVAPIYQHFDPVGEKGMALFREAERLGLPVLCHQGTTFVRDAPLRYARPWLLDEVATACPDLTLWIAHLGHPWCEETMAVIRKHPRLFADVSALHTRPVQLYLALRAAVEYRVADKLLLGSDFPFATLDETVTALRAVNDVVAGSAWPPIPEDVVEGIIERDGLEVVGLT